MADIIWVLEMSHIIWVQLGLLAEPDGVLPRNYDE